MLGVLGFFLRHLILVLRVSHFHVHPRATHINVVGVDGVVGSIDLGIVIVRGIVIVFVAGIDVGIVVMGIGMGAGVVVAGVAAGVVGVAAGVVAHIGIGIVFVVVPILIAAVVVPTVVVLAAAVVIPAVVVIADLGGGKW